MSNFFIGAITPKDTEEVKPGLFIQKKLGGYRQVHPSAWDGKINWKNFIFGGSIFKGLGFFLIIIFLAWSYQHDVAQYQDFYQEVRSDPIAYCEKVRTAIDVSCSEEQERNGLCVRFGNRELSNPGLLLPDK